VISFLVEFTQQFRTFIFVDLIFYFFSVLLCIPLKTYRSKGVKLYEEFKQTTFDSINEFNRSEYIKFYKKAFPKSNPRLLTLVDNYFICCVDEFPVGNYHLYSKTRSEVMNGDTLSGSIKQSPPKTIAAKIAIPICNI